MDEGDEIQVVVSASNSLGSNSSNASSGLFVAAILIEPGKMDPVTIVIDTDSTTDDDIYFKVEWPLPTDDGGDPI